MEGNRESKAKTFPTFRASTKCMEIGKAGRKLSYVYGQREIGKARRSLSLRFDSALNVGK